MPNGVLSLVATGFIFSSLFAMTADVVDYGEWKFGIRSEGLVNSCTSFGLAAGSWITAFGGYDGTATVQTQADLEAKAAAERNS